MIEPETLRIFGLAFFVLLLGAIVGIFLYQKISKWQLESKLSKRFEIAALGEKSATELLLEQGYIIEKVQKVFKLSMWVNGQKLDYDVRPDAFVIKDGKKYLVEIKTGKNATDPKSIATRRQLLEYFHGFDVEGILFVDAVESQIHNIHFPTNEKVNIEKVVTQISGSKKELFWAFFLGVIITYFAVVTFS